MVVSEYKSRRATPENTPPPGVGGANGGGTDGGSKDLTYGHGAGGVDAGASTGGATHEAAPVATSVPIVVEGVPDGDVIEAAGILGQVVGGVDEAPPAPTGEAPSSEEAK